MTFKEREFKDNNFYELIFNKVCHRNHIKNRFSKNNPNANKDSGEKKDGREKIEHQFEKTFFSLVNSEDTEISPKYDNIYNQIFSKPVPLKTQLEFHLKTRLYIEDHSEEKRTYTALPESQEGMGWNQMYVIAESGQWLYNLLKTNIDEFHNYETCFKGKEVSLIYADNLYIPELKEKFKGLTTEDSLNFRYLPWWQHNQHMTIFLNKFTVDGKTYSTPLRALYFTRRLRSPHISPVELTSANDLKIILQTFEAYKRKSEILYHGKNIGNEASHKWIKSNRGIHVNKKDINESMKEYHFIHNQVSQKSKKNGS